MQIHEGTLTLTYKEIVARDTLLMRFSVRVTNGNMATLPFLAGQFLSMEFGPKAWRAYSIASHPSEDQIELVVRLVEGGVASEIFREASINQIFNFKGPFGHFILSDNTNATLNFCATGTGIAPLRSMIIEEASQPTPRPMRLFYGGRDREDMAYLEDLQHWSDNLEIHLGLSRVEQKQRITALLEEFTFTRQDEFYLCGSGPMVKSVNEVLSVKKVTKEQIYQERFN